MRWLTSILVVVCFATLALFLGRLPLGIETSFAGGSATHWRFLRGPDVSGALEGAGGARGVLAVLKDASSWKAVAADTLGNVLALAGVGGEFTRRTFDPWGNPLTRDASGSLRASTLQERRADYDALPLAWASQEVDPDTGLTHYHFREYSPSLGGWLTRDPIGLAGGYLNLRSYLGNRPTDALDVWGEEAYAWDINGTKTTMSNSKELLSHLTKAKDKSIKKLDIDGHGESTAQTLDLGDDGRNGSKAKKGALVQKGTGRVILTGEGLDEVVKEAGINADSTLTDSDGRVRQVFVGWDSHGFLVQRRAVQESKLA